MGLLSRTGSWMKRWWGSGGEGAIMRSKPTGVGSIEDLALEEKSVRPGDLIPSWWDGKARWSEFDAQEALEVTYLISWVYICATKIARTLGQIPWVGQIQQTDGTWIDDPNSEVAALLNQPNEFWSRSHFIQMVMLELLLTGNSLVCKLRDTEGRITELFTIRPQRIAPILSRGKYITGYEVRTADNKKVVIATEDVVHLQFPNPANKFWGLSPLQAAIRATDTEKEAADWQKFSLQNMMIPPGIFQFDSHISPDQMTAAGDDLKKNYQTAINARRPMLMGGGGREAKWVPLSLTPMEVDFLSTRKLTREEICAIYWTPPPIVGIMDNSTYNNIRTAKDIWWEDPLIPMLSMLADAWNMSLVPEFDAGVVTRVRPDTSKVVALLAATERQVAIVKDLFGMGVSFNLASEAVSLGIQIPAGQGGDVGWLPSNLIPLTTGSTDETFQEDVDAMPVGTDDVEERSAWLDARLRRGKPSNGKAPAESVESLQKGFQASLDQARKDLH